ncbi:MAG: DM13 domain-containing protein [Pseudomonadota bacterium]
MSIKFPVVPFVLAAAFVALGGCGGGSGSDDSGDSNDNISGESVQSSFRSPLVSGLSYSTGDAATKTADDGSFGYTQGSSVNFSVGDIVFSTSPDGDIEYLSDLAGTHIFSETAFVNTARLFYSLDFDGNAENGIQIDERVDELATGISADTNADQIQFESSVANLISSNGTNGAATTVLIDPEQTRRLINAELNTDGVCAQTHPKVGEVADLSTIAHGVRGRIRVVDDCTLEVTGFYYDGQGLNDVRFYNLDNGETYGDNLFGRAHSDRTFQITIDSASLDDLDRISVWCIPARSSFGEGSFR